MKMKNDTLIDIIREDLTKHEGFVREIYLDSEHLPTFGIGHLITEADPEYTYPVGTPIEDRRIIDVFLEDLDVAVDDADAVFNNVFDHPDNVVRVLINMAFNLGRTRLRGFKNMIAAVDANFYDIAAEEMVDSKWYRQVKRRGKELEALMRSAA